MSILNTLNRFRLLSYERGELAICSFAEHAEEEINNPGFEEHVKVLRQEYGVDGLIYLTEANRILYFFTTEKALEEEAFLHSFFARTHPELQNGKIRDLLGNTLLYQGTEAVDYLFRFSLNHRHLTFIPPLLGQLLERSREYGISNAQIELAVSRIMEKAEKIGAGQLHLPKGEEDFNLMIEEEVIALSRLCREASLAEAFKKVPEKVSVAKLKAIRIVFGKEFEALNEKTKDLALRMMNYMEDECKDIPGETLDKLKDQNDNP